MAQRWQTPIIGELIMALSKPNVNAVAEVARMIEVQRAYELGQSFLDAEDSRIRDFLRTAGNRS